MKVEKIPQEEHIHVKQLKNVEIKPVDVKLIIHVKLHHADAAITTEVVNVVATHINHVGIVHAIALNINHAKIVLVV